MAETLHRPATLRSDAAKRPVGIDRDRMADGLEERDVGGRVGVGRRAREVDSPIAGELACKTVGTGKLEDVENIVRQALELLRIADRGLRISIRYHLCSISCFR